jgi:hypothetical protein
MIDANSEGKIGIKHSVESLFYPSLPLDFCPAPLLDIVYLALAHLLCATSAKLSPENWIKSSLGKLNQELA